MRYLLDTHIMIWQFEADPKLPEHLQKLIDSPAHTIYVSIASLWEMAIKTSMAKLTLSKSLSEIFQHIHKVGFEVFPIHDQHLLGLETLPFHHRDPFDRLLIATALAEDLTLISADRHFQTYEGLKLIWN